MQEYEMIGRIAELEDEVAWQEEQMANVWGFLRHASESDTDLGRSVRYFLKDLRDARTKHREHKLDQQFT